MAETENKPDASVDPAAVATPAATEPKAKKVKADAVKADTVTVVCHVAAGRRRGDRRWVGGETTIPAADLTDDLRAALEADPMFQIVE